MEIVTLSQLKQHPGKVIDTALREGAVGITRHGKPVAVLTKVIVETEGRFPSSYLQWFAGDVIREAPVVITRHGRPVVSIVKNEVEPKSEVEPKGEVEPKSEVEPKNEVER